jgi:hypothetical protein
MQYGLRHYINHGVWKRRTYMNLETHDNSRSKENRKTLSTIIILLIGILIGFAISLSIGAILSYIDPGTRLKKPKTFGDIKVWAGRPTDVGCAPNPDIDEMLVMEKDGVPFLEIHKNKADQISGLYLIKNTTNEPIFFMEPLKARGKWGCATYSKGSGTGHAVGDALMDIDFDGRFDFKMVLDDKGKLVSRSIYIDGAWQEVDRANVDRMKAIMGQTWYTFDPNTGCWQPE